MISGWASILKRCRPDEGVSRDRSEARVTLRPLGGRRGQGCISARKTPSFRSISGRTLLQQEPSSQLLSLGLGICLDFRHLLVGY